MKVGKGYFKEASLKILTKVIDKALEGLPDEFEEYEGQGVVWKAVFDYTNHYYRDAFL